MSENRKKFKDKFNSYNILISLVILLGIFLRLKGYLYNPSFWHDECALAWNVKFKSYPELFGVLNFLQVTPVLFLIITKILTQIFGYSEQVFRLIPFVCGISSVLVFYLLSKKVFSSKISVFAAVFLFAVNSTLINYSFEFKPYGLDVFFVIICLLFFVNLDIEKLNVKKALLFGIFLSVIPWFSFASVFILAGGFINLFLNKIKSNWNQKIALFMPLLLSSLIYLKTSLLANYTGTQMVSGWQGYFITLNVKHFLWLFTENLDYLFWPCTYVLFLLIFILWGIFLLYKEKNSFFNVAVASLAFFIIVSLLKIYPFAERLALFLTPIFMLFMIKPLDLVPSQNKLKSSLIIFLFLITFYPQIIYTEELLSAKIFDKQAYPREMVEFMIKKLHPHDIIFVSEAAAPEFAYYSSFYKIKNKVIQEKIGFAPSKKYLNKLNELQNGYYWFYMPDDYVDNPVIPWVENWAKKSKIIYIKKTGKKYKGMLMYVYVSKR